jgi:hypothetical protein
MISNEKELTEFIDSLLKPHGYTKKKDTWYARINECICFVAIVKSSYGGYYEEAIG